MAIARSKQLRINPIGVSDTIDGSNTNPGLMSSLSNLVPAPSTRGVWVPRSASSLIVQFPADYVNLYLQV